MTRDGLDHRGVDVGDSLRALGLDVIVVPGRPIIGADVRVALCRAVAAIREIATPFEGHLFGG